MVKCIICDQDMIDQVSCHIPPVVIDTGEQKDGKRRILACVPIPHGKETRASWGDDGKPCHDCGAPVGGYHHLGCDVEECPNCNHQMISCDCAHPDFELDALPQGVLKMELWLGEHKRFKLPYQVEKVAVYGGWGLTLKFADPTDRELYLEVFRQPVTNL